MDTTASGANPPVHLAAAMGATPVAYQVMFNFLHHVSISDRLFWLLGTAMLGQYRLLRTELSCWRGIQLLIYICRGRWLYEPEQLQFWEPILPWSLV